MTPIQIASFNTEFSDEICSWVPDEETLRLISNDERDGLRRDLLHEWIEQSIDGYCLLVEGQLTGFATVGVEEWDFPPGICEIGHLIIHPSFRRRYFGTMMIYGLFTMARREGYEAAVARVVPDNTPALEMFKKEHWTKVDEPWCVSQFVWFRKECEANHGEKISPYTEKIEGDKGLVA